MPWYVEPDSYMIGGTQLIPFKLTQDSDDISEYHVILKNFEFKDF
jgi:hypothetical protein